MHETTNPPSDPTIDSSLASIALQSDAYAAVLDRHRLDFCCHGRRSLGQACADAGLDPNHILAELAEEAQARAGTAIDWRDQPLTNVIRHLEDTHHRFTREALARIGPLLTRVVGRHRDAHAELPEVSHVFQSLADELLPHLAREEQILFPYIAALAAGSGTPPPFGSIANPVRVMIADHETVGVLLDRLRSLTNAFTPPADGCSSYRALYAALSELRRDLLVHVALENEVLFPQAVALAQLQKPQMNGAQRA